MIFRKFSALTWLFPGTYCKLEIQNYIKTINNANRLEINHSCHMLWTGLLAKITVYGRKKI